MLGQVALEDEARNATNESFFRELRVDRVWERTSEIQRSIISRGVFKRGAAPYLSWD
jgi:alkylation response protein AidB-like acyl-CoA dehydrogenase